MKIIKLLFKIALFLLILILLLWIIISVTLQTEKGKHWVFDRVIHYVEEATDLQIQVAKIDFIPPLHVRFHQLNIQKNNAKLAFIEQLDLSCMPAHLLNGRVVCPSVYAKNVSIANVLPLLEQSPNNHPTEKKNWEHPLPFYAKIENLNIENLHLDADLIEALVADPQLRQRVAASQLDLKGSLSNNPFRSCIKAHLILTATATDHAYPPLQLGVDMANCQIDLSLQSQQFALDRFAPEQLDQVTGDFILKASAPLAVWSTFLNQEGPLSENIEGSYAIELHSNQSTQKMGQLIGKETQCKGNYQFSSLEHIELLDCEIDSPAFFLSANATFNALNLLVKECQFAGEMRHEWLDAHLPPEFVTSYTFLGNLEGPLTAPLIDFQLNAPKVIIENQILHHTQANLKLSLEPLEGTLELSAQHSLTPIRMHSNFKLDTTSLSLSNFHASLASFETTGQLKLSFSDQLAEGQLDLNIPDMRVLSDWIDLPITGDAHVRLLLQPEQTFKHTISCEIEAQNVNYLDWHTQHVNLRAHVSDTWQQLLKATPLFFQAQLQNVKGKEGTIEQLNLQGDGQLQLNPLELNHLAGNLEGHVINWADNQVDSVRVAYQLPSLTQPWEGHLDFDMQNWKKGALLTRSLAGEFNLHPKALAPFYIKAMGTYPVEVALETKGLWHWNGQILDAQVDSIKGHLGAYAFDSQHSFQIAYQEKKAELKDMVIQLGGATFKASASLENDLIKSDFQGEGIPAEFFQLVNPNIPLKGQSAFYGHLEGPLSHPSGKLKILLHNIEITEDILTNHPKMESEWDVEINQSGMHVQGILTGIGKTPMQAKGILPFTLSLAPPRLSLDNQLPFQFHVQAEGEINPFLHLFYSDTSNLTGQANLSLTLEGNISAPQIRGQVNLVNGSYESLSTGALYKNIEAHIEGDGSQLILKSFSAQDSKQGSITATGSVLLDAQKQFPFTFQLHPSKMFIMNADYATIAASGTLELTGTKEHGAVHGTLQTDQMDISMEGALPTQVKSVDFKYINVQEGKKDPNLALHETKWPLQLDVKLKVPGKAKIRGKNLQSEWRGEINISGTPSDPLLYGELRVINGEYDFNGKKFLLSQGNIHFAGQADKKTSLYVVAAKEIGKIRAEIIVKGPISKIAISFRSNPPLSQREILSYILFGQGISDITPDQGELLTQSFIELNSMGNDDKSSNDFLSRLRNNIGIDRLDFTTADGTDGSKDFGLQVGKYISEGVYVSINKSMNTVAPRVAIEAKLRKNWQAQAEVGNDAQGKLLLKWKKDY
jgi:translocation and assembly module TamB